tara:strand:- start:2734 stop:3483 length:750 start_codon:yes stop_codon:yes gene_type:complete
MKTIVSIIIPFYENLFYLKRSLNSIIQQSFKNYEIIIINDNPNVKKILELRNFIKKIKYQKIKIINNKKNYGAGVSRNKGIKVAKGEYIAFLDSDDVWHKNKLNIQIKIMKKNRYLASHTTYNLVDVSQNYISCRKAKNLKYNNLLNSCDIGLSTVILKKKILKMKNPFPSLKTKEDYVLWLKLSKKGIIFYGIDIKLVNWTNTPRSLSKSIYQKIKDSIRVYYVYEKLNLIQSIFRTLILSLNYLKKN